MKIRSFGGPVNRHQRRLRGRILRENEGGSDNGGAQGGSDSSGQSNNAGNSGGDSGGTGNGSNNSGDDFDPASFWKQPAAVDDGSGSGNGTPAPNQQQQQQAPTLGDRIKGFDVGEIFSKDALDSLNNEQDPKKFHDNMNGFARNLMTQTLRMAFEVMEQQQESQTKSFQEMIEGRFGKQADQEGLAKEFPSYSKPGMKPVIDGIFKQAMTVTKNDRDAAIKMTKTMLSYSTREMSGDLGLNQAPGTEPTQKTDWFESLGLTR